MKRSKTVFITSKDDGHADYVISKMNETEKGDQVVRINTEDFVHNCLVTFTENSFDIQIVDSGRRISREEIVSVWFRRPKDFSHITADHRETAFVHKQANALLRGLYFSTHDSAKWINPLNGLHRARVKLQQLVLAKSMGFNVPKTLVTNKSGDVLSFLETVELVSTKSLDEPNYQIDNYSYPMFNRRLSKEYIIDKLDHLPACPTLFQEYIMKQADIRVVVIGSNMFCFKIHSQENEFSCEDFRGVSPSILRHEEVSLPGSLKSLIFEFVTRQNLVYSSLDFVYSKEGEYFFIENNANGQWLWLELQTGVRISDSIIAELLN